MQIPIRRISLFDIRKNEEELAAIAKDIEQTIYQQGHIVEFTIDYIKRLLEKYGPAFPRKTESPVLRRLTYAKSRRDVKVYHDRVNYYLGTNVKPSSKDAAPIVCQTTTVWFFTNDGACRVISVPEKEYIG